MFINMKRLKLIFAQLLFFIFLTNISFGQLKVNTFHLDSTLQNIFRDSLIKNLSKNLNNVNLGDTNFALMFSIRFKVNEKNQVFALDNSILMPIKLIPHIKKSIEQTLDVVKVNKDTISVFENYLLIPIIVVNYKKSLQEIKQIKEHDLIDLFTFKANIYNLGKHDCKQKMFENLIINTICIRTPWSGNWNNKFSKYYKPK